MWYSTKDTRWKKESLIVGIIGSTLLSTVITAGYTLTSF